MENTVIKHFLHLFLLGLQFQVSYPPTLDRSIDVQLSSLYVAISPSYKSLVKWTRDSVGPEGVTSPASQTFPAQALTTQF